MQHVPRRTRTLYISVFYMNYINQLQADKAEALDSARSIETEINDLISYLCCDKFRVDTRVQVGDVLRVIPPIQNTVIQLDVTTSKAISNDKKK
jgi:hypothetical protein